MKLERYRQIESRLDNAQRLISMGRTGLSTAAQLCISEVAEAVHMLSAIVSMSPQPDQQELTPPSNRGDDADPDLAKACYHAAALTVALESIPESRLKTIDRDGSFVRRMCLAHAALTDTLTDMGIVTPGAKE